MHIAFLSRSALPILCLAFIACGKKAATPNPADPNTPAVVQLPAFVPPGESSQAPDAARANEARIAEARRTLGTNYSILGAALVFGDARMTGSFYAPDAVLVTPDAEHRGSEAIAKAYSDMGPAKSLREFNRVSLVTRVDGTVVTDSGTYLVLTQRTGADSLLERGRYAATWQIRQAPQSWVITKDHLYRERARKGR